MRSGEFLLTGVHKAWLFTARPSTKKQFIKELFFYVPASL